MTISKSSGTEQPSQGKEESFYGTLLNSLPLGIYHIDKTGKILFANTILLTILDTKHTSAVGLVIYDLLSDYNANRHRYDDAEVMATGVAIDKVVDSGESASGRKYYLREIKTPLRNAAGEVVGMQGILLDVTEQMQAQAALAESEERFNLFMDTLPAAVFIKNQDSTTLYCNRYMADILGAKSWIGKTVRDLFPPALAEKMIADDQHSLAAGYVVIEEQVPSADGKLRLYQTHKFAIPRQGRAPLLGGIALDITDRKQAELELQSLNEQLRMLAATDQLTALANRRRAIEILDHELERQKRYGTEFSVIMLDVDHFKAINDRFGHQTGDRVLSQIAAIIASHVRASDIPSRWGGEEFLVVCPETDLDGAAALAELLRQRIAQHEFAIASSVTASFGVANSSVGQSIDVLIKRADEALYVAKGNERNCVVRG